MNRAYTIHESIGPERAAFLTREVEQTLPKSHGAFYNLAEQVAPSLQELLPDRRYGAIVSDGLRGRLPFFVIRSLASRWAQHKDIAAPRIITSGTVDTRGRPDDVDDFISSTYNPRVLFVTDVVREKATGRACTYLQDRDITVDVAGLQSHWPDAGYYKRYWEQQGWSLNAVRIFPGLQGSEHDPLLEAPALVLARDLQEKTAPYEADLGAITVPEHQLLMDAARDHLEGLAKSLYAEHFPPSKATRTVY